MTTTANDVSSSISRILDRFESMACLNVSVDESTSYAFRAQSTSSLNEITKSPSISTSAGRAAKSHVPPKTKPKPKASLGLTKPNNDNSNPVSSNSSTSTTTDTITNSAVQSSNANEGQIVIAESHFSARQSSKDLEDEVFDQESSCTGSDDCTSHDLQTVEAVLACGNAQSVSNVRRGAFKMPPPLPASRHWKKGTEQMSEPSASMTGQSASSVSVSSQLSLSETNGLTPITNHLIPPEAAQVSHVTKIVSDVAVDQLPTATSLKSQGEDCSEPLLPIDAACHHQTASRIVDERVGMAAISPNGVKPSRGPPPPIPVRNTNTSISNLSVVSRNVRVTSRSSSTTSPKVQKNDDHSRQLTTSDTLLGGRHGNHADDVIVKQVVNTEDEQKKSLKDLKDREVAVIRQSGDASSYSTSSTPLLPPTPPSPSPLATTRTTPPADTQQLNTKQFQALSPIVANAISSSQSFVSDKGSWKLITAKSERPKTLYPPGVQNRDLVMVENCSPDMCLTSDQSTATPNSIVGSSSECSGEEKGRRSNCIDIDHDRHDTVDKNDLGGPTDEQLATTRHSSVFETNAKVIRNGDRSIINESAGNRKSYIIYAEQIGESFTFLDDFDDAEQLNDGEMPPPPSVLIAANNVFQTSSTDTCLSLRVSATDCIQTTDVSGSISGPSSSSAQSVSNVNSAAMRPRDIRRPTAADIDDYKRMSAGRLDAIMTVNDAFSFLELGDNV